MFDLDCDGIQENVSFAGKGSGFLALDLNEDGKDRLINLKEAGVFLRESGSVGTLVSLI